MWTYIWLWKHLLEPNPPVKVWTLIILHRSQLLNQRFDLFHGWWFTVNFRYYFLYVLNPVEWITCQICKQVLVLNFKITEVLRSIFQKKKNGIIFALFLTDVLSETVSNLASMSGFVYNNTAEELVWWCIRFEFDSSQQSYKTV